MKQRKTSTPKTKIRPFDAKQMVTFLKRTQEGKYSVVPKVTVQNRISQPKPVSLEDNYFYSLS